MAIINTKLIKYATQARFDIDIAKVPAIIDSKSIVFIQDTGRIYAHGKYFGGAWEDIHGRPTKLSQFTDDIGIGTHLVDTITHITAAERINWNKSYN